ncbi:RDD family protein [Flexivirga caeni]|uniref:RDD family protein n=1 Tax=Flexivirga caeni TaxID=2294115 RepID=A0A3M9MEP5_9MICO|nr:RDD family protein [Flexivirga caeni]RNI23313.1 RDD family protein [Flexivirga caeni]
MTERASGWYDDPDDPSLLRYWDGILWSDRTMPKVKPHLDESRIGDPRKQWEEEQERLRAAQPGGYPQAGPSRFQQGPRLQRGVGQGPSPYGYQQQYQARPVKMTPDGEPTASWWRRLFAYLIDNILVSLVAVVISWSWLQPWIKVITDWYDAVLTAAKNGGSQPPVPSALYHVPWQFPVVSLLIYLVYEIGLVAWRGQTIGHLICGVRVRGAGSAAKPEINAAVIRALVKGVSNITTFIPVLGSLGSVFSLVDGLIPLGERSAQSIHDKAAKTYVVRARPPKVPVGTLPPYPGG